MKIAAFDIGGTALKMGVVLPHGEIILTKSAEIIASDGDQILAEMKLFLAENTDVTGIAVSAPGYVNPKTGLITMGGAIRRFDNFNLKEWLEAETEFLLPLKMTPIAPFLPKNGLVKDKIWMIFFV